MWRIIIDTRGTLLVLHFFLNVYLTEWSIVIFLQSAGNNVEQKKVQGLMSKWGESSWNNNILKSLFNYTVLPFFFKIKKTIIACWTYCVTML